MSRRSFEKGGSLGCRCFPTSRALGSMAPGSNSETPSWAQTSPWTRSLSACRYAPERKPARPAWSQLLGPYGRSSSWAWAWSTVTLLMSVCRQTAIRGPCSGAWQCTGCRIGSMTSSTARHLSTGSWVSLPTATTHTTTTILPRALGLLPSPREAGCCYTQGLAQPHCPLPPA